MNLTKRFLAFATAVIMLFSACLVVNAAEYSAEVTSTVTVDEGVILENLEIVSGENGNTVTGVSLEFDPADGYMPMVFSAWAGSAGLLGSQYDIATNKYGYDVVGVINGAFFDMATATYGTLNGMVISNGKIASTHAGLSEPVVAFDSDGTMHFVDSSLAYTLYINGEEINNAIYYINKTSGNADIEAWNSNFYYYDTSCGSTVDTKSVCPGYEVVCEKLDNTDLIVGGTLIGKVLEVRADSYGASIADNKYDLSDKFVLFVRSDSPKAEYVKDLVEGDSINISVTETIEESREIMENANSVISNVGFLVKDGVDRTQIDKTIGTHSVTLEARWTAFGQREDGSYVYFTSEGASTGESGSITLRDVAKYMISKGCVNVIRMDGGGSSAMYVKNVGDGTPGYAQYSSRSVGDSILVVKKSSTVDSDLVAALQEKYEVAYNEVMSGTASDSLLACVDEAAAILESESPVSGDVRRAYMNLSIALSGKDELSELISKAVSVKVSEYSEENLAKLREAYAEALDLYFATDATKEDIQAVCDDMNAVFDAKGEGDLVANSVYIQSFDTYVVAGTSTIFTPDMGELTADNANLNWTWNVRAKWSAARQVYIITETFGNLGTLTPAVTLAEDEILVSVHGDPDVIGAQDNKATLTNTAAIGKQLFLYGIDVENKSVGVAAYVKVGDAPSVKLGDINDDTQINYLDYILLKRAVMGSYTISEDVKAGADVNEDLEVNYLDYILLKRAVMGSYTLI